eukprot:INCI10404.1.p1 GENE.INCI10404.1~~INCI10404.1.p1  ORF type:complete len:407 (-),score=50.66 INCI10404.1:59-1279(-)
MARRRACGYSRAVSQLVVMVNVAALLASTRGSLFGRSFAATNSLDTASCDRLVHMYAEPKSGTNYLEESFLAVGQILCGSRHRSSLTTDTSVTNHHRMLNDSSVKDSSFCHGFSKSPSVRGGGRGFSFFVDNLAAGTRPKGSRAGVRRVCFVMKDKFELPNSGKMCQSHLFPVSGLGGWPFSAPCGILPHQALAFPSLPSSAEISSGKRVAECATTCATEAVASMQRIEHKALRGSVHVNNTHQGSVPPRMAYVYLHRDPRNTAISACFHANRVPANATSAELGECLQRVFANVAMRMEVRRLFFHLVAAAAPPNGPAVSFLNYESMLQCPVLAFRMLAHALLLDGAPSALKEAAQATSVHGEAQYQVATLRDAGHRTYRDYGLSDVRAAAPVFDERAITCYSLLT